MKRTSILAALTLVACVNNPEDPPQFDPLACDDFVVMQQMGLGWGLLNHRVSTWEVGFDHDNCLAEDAEIVHIGGDFSTGESPTGTDDAPFLKLGWQVASTDRERVGVSRVAIKDTVGPEGRVTGTKTFTRTDLDLRRYPDLTVVIDGISFETGVEQTNEYPDNYDPAHGYTLRGFGAGARIVEATRADVTIEYDFHFEMANSPDRPRHNEALEFARVGAKIDLLVIGSDDVPVHTRSVDYEMSYPPPTPLEDQEIPPPDADKTAISIDGSASAPRGFWGISNFDFQYAFDGSCSNDMECAFADTCGDDGYCTLGRQEPGEYLREITITLNQDSYDPASGDAEFTLEGYTSNASRFLANYPLEYTFTGAMVWVQAGETSEPERVCEEFATGPYSRPLELGEGDTEACPKDEEDEE